MTEKLTKKQRAFIREYKANGGNGTQAAKKAGYSEHTAREMAKENLTKPLIREELAKEEKKMQEKYQYTLDDMVRELNDALASSAEEHNRSAQLKAIELKGKAFGLFVDRVEQNTNITGIKQISVKWK
jgi:phage terminase small subunit